MNYSEQILKARFEQLPEDIREAIMATPWREKLKQISDRHNLHIDQAGHLGEETVLVMFGIEHADNLIANIAKHAEISEEKAEAIAEDLNREIFLKVRESLKKIFEERDEKGEDSSFLGDSLLGKRDKKETEGSLLGKTGEEELNRESILREIEDKEHHNLPSTNKTELHLEIPFPSEIVEKSTNFHLEASLPSEIAPSGQGAFQNQKMTDEIKREKPIEINLELEQIAKKPFESKDEALRTMPKDIIKAKMGGTVSVPKETVEIGDVVPPPKMKLPDVGKIDPYRESVG